MRILFLSRWFPYPADNGSRIRIYNLLRALASRHTVDLISFAYEPVAEERLAAMHTICQQVDVVLFRDFQPSSWKALLGFFELRPRSVVDTYSPEMEDKVIETVRRGRYDVVIASEIDMAPYAANQPVPIRLLEEMEIAALWDQTAQAKSLAQRARKQLMWWKYSRYVSALLKDFQATTVVSEQERQYLVPLVPTRTHLDVIPNGVDTAFYSGRYGMPDPDTLIYSGALTYSANFDAVNYFLEEIFPLILAARPQTRFLVTGRLEGVSVQNLPRVPNLVFTGYLDDIRPTLARAWVNVVPIRRGGGTRLKILESLAIGTPVISTRKGAEGLDLQPNHDLLVTDTPAEFAQAVLRLLADAALRARLSKQGQQTVINRYDWSIIGQRLNTLLDMLSTRARLAPETKVA